MDNHSFRFSAVSKRRHRIQVSASILKRFEKPAPTSTTYFTGSPDITRWSDMGGVDLAIWTMHPSPPTKMMSSGTGVSFIQNFRGVNLSIMNSIPWVSANACRPMNPFIWVSGVSAISIKMEATTEPSGCTKSRALLTQIESADGILWNSWRLWPQEKRSHMAKEKTAGNPRLVNL